MKCSLLTIAFLVFVAGSAQAQSNKPGSAPNQNQTGSGSNQGASGSGVSAEQANNPSEPILQLTFQDWYSGSLDGFGSHGKDSNLVLFQPIIPIPALGPLPFEIARLQVPVLTNPDNTTALGDISGVDVFIVVNKPGLRIGLGPTFSLPTDTYHLAGTGEWELGPAGLIVYSGVKGWVFAVLAQNPISFAGRRDSADTNMLSFQPFVVKLLPGGFFIREDPIMTFDWEKSGAATIPINVGVGRFFKIGSQAINAYVQPEWNLHRPADDRITPRFTLRFSVTFLLPQKK